jgi:hypothetical protein
MPKASESTATAVVAGLFKSVRKANRMSPTFSSVDLTAISRSVPNEAVA